MDTNSEEFKYAKKFWTERIANQGITNLSEALTDTNNDISVVRSEINKKLRETPPPSLKIPVIKDAVEYIYNNWHKVMLGDQEEDNVPNRAKSSVSNAKFDYCNGYRYNVTDNINGYEECMESERKKKKEKEKQNIQAKYTKLCDEEKQKQNEITLHKKKLDGPGAHDGTGGKTTITLKTQLKDIQEKKTIYKEQHKEVNCPQPGGGRKRKSRKRRKRKTKRRRRRGGTKKKPNKKKTYKLKKKPPRRKPNRVYLTVHELPTIKESNVEKSAFKKMFKSTIEKLNPNKILVKPRALVGPRPQWKKDGANRPIKMPKTRKGGRKRRRRRTKKRRRRRW